MVGIEIFSLCGDLKKDGCIILGMNMFGLVQEASPYHKKGIKIIKNEAFACGCCQPMPSHEKSKKGVVYIVLYLGNDLLIGHTGAIKDIVCFILVFKDEYDHDYLSCNIDFCG